MKHTVNAVTNTEVMFARLDVNIGSLVLDALADEQVHEANDRRVIFGRFVVVCGESDIRGCCFLLKLAAEARQLTIGAVESIERGLEVAAFGDDNANLASRC